MTGAARGSGEAIARRLHADGAVVWVTDLDEAGARLAVGARLDVRDEAAWDAALDRIDAAQGRPDVLVNNAGLTGFDPPAVHDPEHASLGEWQVVFRTNLDGTFLGCRAALRALRDARTGVIVNIGSRFGATGVLAATAYAVSKAAIANHTRTVALCPAQQGWSVRCVAIQPAAVRIPMWAPMVEGVDDPAAVERAIVADISLRRFAEPDPGGRGGGVGCVG